MAGHAGGMAGQAGGTPGGGGRAPGRAGRTAGDAGGYAATAGRRRSNCASSSTTTPASTAQTPRSSAGDTPEDAVPVTVAVSVAAGYTACALSGSDVPGCGDQLASCPATVPFALTVLAPVKESAIRASNPSLLQPSIDRSGKHADPVTETSSPVRVIDSRTVAPVRCPPPNSAPTSSIDSRSKLTVLPTYPSASYGATATLSRINGGTSNRCARLVDSSARNATTSWPDTVPAASTCNCAS